MARTVVDQLPAAQVNEVVVAANCWCCGMPRYKRVHRRFSRHQHFTWSCDGCAVDWTGPGNLLSDP